MKDLPALRNLSTSRRCPSPFGSDRPRRRFFAIRVRTIGLSCIVLAISVACAADEWRARTFATVEAHQDSPDGCFRIKALRPYFLSDFKSDPMPLAKGTLRHRWIQPRFYRIYDRRDGRALDESPIFDMRNLPAAIDWFAVENQEYREVWVAGHLLLSTRRCAAAVVREDFGGARGTI